MKLLVVILTCFCVSFQTAQAESKVAVSVSWPECDPRFVTWHSHPLTCTKYVLCYHGNSVEIPCAPGLHFNRVLEQCMLPQLAKCDINYACPSEDDELNPVFLPNPNDCSAYFVCFKGTPLPRICAESLWWDIEFSWCTVFEEVTCDSRTPNDPNRPPTSSTPGLITTSTIPPTTTSTTAPTTTTTTPTTTTTTTTPATTTTSTPTTTTTRTTTIPTTTPRPIIRYDCPLTSGTTLHPHPQNCQLFFECINGISFMRQCSRGNIFDVATSQCQLEDSAQCVLD